MNVVVLAGGYGGRIKNLTLTRPMLLIEFINKPVLVHIVEQLSKAKIDELFLVADWETKEFKSIAVNALKGYNIKINFVNEKTPKGSAGVLCQLKEELGKTSEPFLLISGDVISDFPLSILGNKLRPESLVKVLTVPSDGRADRMELTKGGCVSNNGLVTKFIGRGSSGVAEGEINSGIYTIRPEIFDHLEHVSGRADIESCIFPALVKGGLMESETVSGFWADLGSAKNYLSATEEYILYNISLSQSNLEDTGVSETVLIHPSAIIGEDCKIGPFVVIGSDVVIGSGVRIRNSVLLEGSTVRDSAFVENAIMGWRSHVGKWARLCGDPTVLGSYVRVEDEVYVNGCTVFPHKSINSTLPRRKIVL